MAWATSPSRAPWSWTATSTCATSATTFGLSTEPSPTSAWDPAASSGTSTPRWPLLALPGFLVAHALVRLGLAPGPADGYGEAYVAGATSMALLLGLLGLWMLLRLAASLCGRGPAAALATFTLLGTPLFFYVLLDPSMSHAAGFCAATLFLHAWLRVERSQAGAASSQPAGGSRQTRDWALLGLAGGVLVLVRLQELVWAVLPAISLWRGLRRAADSRQRWLLVRRAGVGAAVFTALIAPQIGVWWYWTGSLTPPYLAGAGHRLDLSSPHFLDTWLSPDHGMFYWHPLLVLGLIGLLPWRRRALGWPMLATLLAITWLVGSWSSWSGAQSFGHRMFVSALPLLALGGTALWRRGRLAPTLAALGVAWNLALLGIYGARMIPAEAPVSHAEMLAAMSQLPARSARILHGFYANREQYTHPPAGAALPTQPDL